MSYLTLETFSPSRKDLYKPGKYSQWQEEEVLKKLLKVLKIDKGTCCEFGAWDGKHLSNVFHLIENGWQGVLIEGDKEKFEEYTEELKNKYNIECISEYVGYNEWKPENKLDNLLKNTSLPIEFDILSIDVDGPDYFILRDMEIYKPKILILEYNSFDIGKEYIIYKKDHIHKKSKFGNSNYSAMIDMAIKKGYIPVANSNNLFCIRKDLYDKYINLPFKDSELLLGPKKYLSLCVEFEYK